MKKKNLTNLSTDKLIIVKWITLTKEQKEESFSAYDGEMRVIYSTHKRFIEGSRFDFGFFSIATEEGFTIISISNN